MRRYDIDSVRVIVFGILIFYHVGMFFAPWSWHIKNNTIYDGLIFPMLFVNQWRLPLLYIISGMGTCYALSKRNGRQFITERFKRLFIPLVIGMIFIVPPQVYFERLDDGQFSGNYFDFWTTQAFVETYPDGNVSWHHLWFLPYLLLFSLVLCPVFLYLSKHPQTWILRKLRSASSKIFGLYVLIIPLFLWKIFLAPHFPSTHALAGDWFTLANDCTLFFIGYLLVSLKDVFWDTVQKNRRKYLLCGIIGFSLLMSLGFGWGSFPGKIYLSAYVEVFNLWSWCLVLIGYAARYLNHKSKTLQYANEAVYPFYILHQTIIVALGYYLKNADWGFLPKFSIMVIGTFGITWLIYEFGIRRYAFIRPLFGLKNKR
ncbi:MAG: acyltransferase family protein [Candidatus Symbiothrix sp.]|jgi:hypothetical protein|nr:acyltransferase family protein [Candidatus Symbiothrix sp.]